MTAEKRFVPWVSLAILVANVAVFAFELAKGGDPLWGPSPAEMFALGGNFGPVTLDGEQWRLASSMFLHYGLIHLGMNMLGVVQVGRFAEQQYGHAAYTVIYVVAGLGGSLATAFRANSVSAGASGALFGLMGAFLAFVLLHRKRVDPATARTQIQNVLILLGVNVWLGFQVPGIDQAAHIGGLVAGFLAALGIELGRKPSSNRLVRVALVAVVGIGAIIGTSLAVGGRASAQIAFEPGLHEFAVAESNILDRWNAFASKNPDDDQIMKLIDDLLPEWEAAQVAYIHAGGNNAELLRYINLRRDGWIAMRDGLRKQDTATFERGLEMFKEAGALVQKMTAR